MDLDGLWVGAGLVRDMVLDAIIMDFTYIVADSHGALNGLNPLGLERFNLLEGHLLRHVRRIGVCLCRRGIDSLRPSPCLQQHQSHHNRHCRVTLSHTFSLATAFRSTHGAIVLAFRPACPICAPMKAPWLCTKSMTSLAASTCESLHSPKSSGEIRPLGTTLCTSVRTRPAPRTA